MSSVPVLEGPGDIMRRLMGPSATAMGGGGGRMGAHEEGKTSQLRDAEPTGAGDKARQVWAGEEGGPADVQATATGSLTHPAQGAGRHAGDGGAAAWDEGEGVMGKLGSLASSAKAALGAGVGLGHGSGAMGAIKGAVGMGGCPFMTSAFGQTLPDATHSLKVGGRPLVSDVVLMEKLQTFTRSKNLERAVHACGSGALGFFRLTKDMSAYTKASFLRGSGTTTPVAARFSTTTYGREFPDEARNPRGLAFKFYTDSGIYDVLSINFPSFFVRDGILGPDAIRSQQRNPANFQVSFDAMLDFMSLVPESMLANTWFWSDHGTPQGWMHMDGYPIHAFKWVNDAGEATYVKYKFVSAQGIRNLTQAEAQRISGIDPDFSKREMWQHINDGGTAEWVLNVQMIPAAELSKCPIDPFDGAKPWPEDLYPYTEVGRIVLNKNPENYHRDVEQIAFSPGRLVQGIEPTPDPLLQARLFLYQDAQLHRLGVNYHQIPVNSPWRNKNYHPVSRDGPMRLDSNGSHEPHYYPNSYEASGSAGGPGTSKTIPDPKSEWESVSLGAEATVARGRNSAHEGDPMADYLPAREFYLSLAPTDRDNLHMNIALALRSVSRKEVWVRWLLACHRTHADYARGVWQQTVAECERVNQKPLVGWEQVEECARKLEGKPLVDVFNGYKPAPIDI